MVTSIYSFTEHYLDTWIYAIGSTDVRTRLYRMGINKYFDIAINDFNILGEREVGGWEWYEKGRNYTAFAVHKKTSKFEL